MCVYHLGSAIFNVVQGMRWQDFNDALLAAQLLLLCTLQEGLHENRFFVRTLLLWVRGCHQHGGNVHMTANCLQAKSPKTSKPEGRTLAQVHERMAELSGSIDLCHNLFLQVRVTARMFAMHSWLRS